MQTNSILNPDGRSVHCDIHGDYVSRNLFGRIWTKCPTCADEESAAAQAREEQQKRREEVLRWEKKLGEAGIPLRFRDRFLDSYIAQVDEQREALQFARDYASEFDGHHSGRCAIFIGEPGTGKTHLACGIALMAMSYGKTAVFTTVARMVRKIRECKSFDSEMSESEAINLYSWPHLLILDEVGIQSGTDAEARSMFDVINTRYENVKPTIFLSNLDLEGVRATLGNRLFDRLREDGCEYKVFAWASYRGAAA
jgi:DNA replication protein DnaC